MTSSRATLDPGVGLTERIVHLPDGRALRTVHGGGPGGPLVVFEAGMSAPAASWIHTQREVSAHARTVSYDRAGYGGSDLDPQPRTLERIVEDLAAMLNLIDEPGPAIFVGHSWGGPILRVLAERHPERVAGLVFVDATVAESMSERTAKLAAVSFMVLSLVARAGGTGLVKKVTVPHGFSPDISEQDVTIMHRDYACARAMQAGRREAQQILSALPVMARLQAAGTPDVPTVCIQAGRIDRGTAHLRPRMNAAAERLMAAAPQGRVVVVEKAGHRVPQECPEAVYAPIVDVIKAVGASA